MKLNLFVMIIVFLIAVCNLPAKALRHQKLFLIVNCSDNGFLGIQNGSGQATILKEPSRSAVWKIYRMGAGRCLLKNYSNKQFLTLNTDTGTLEFSEKKATGSYWMQINRGAKGKYFLKSLSKGDYRGQFICTEGSQAGMEKDRRQKKCLWKMQRLKNHLYAYNVLKKNMGTKTFDLILLRKEQQIWAQEDITIPMSKKSSFVKVELPDYKYDKIRLQIKEPYGKRIALSEVQIFEGFENIALGSQVTASEEYGKKYKKTDVSSAKIVDNIIDHYKRKKKKGFWLINNKEGWIEIDLSQKLKSKED